MAAQGMEEVEVGVVNQEEARRNGSGGGFTHFSIYDNNVHSPTLEAMELGRK